MVGDFNGDGKDDVAGYTAGRRIIDNGDEGFSMNANSSFALGSDPLSFGGDYRSANSGTGSNWVDWAFTGLTSGRYYTVAATWTPGSNRATDAPYSVFGGVSPCPAATRLATVRVDQTLPPDDFNESGVSWEGLPTVQIPWAKRR